MMSKSIALLVGFMISVCSHAGDCPLAGIWISHEEKTVESMNQSTSLSEKQRNMLGDGFFGQQKIKIDCSEFTTMFDDRAETVAYKLLEIDGNMITVTYFDELESKDVQGTAILEPDGQCYSVPIEHLGFREYFCRIQ